MAPQVPQRPRPAQPGERGVIVPQGVGLVRNVLSGSEGIVHRQRNPHRLTGTARFRRGQQFAHECFLVESRGAGGRTGEQQVHRGAVAAIGAQLAHAIEYVARVGRRGIIARKSGGYRIFPVQRGEARIEGLAHRRRGASDLPGGGAMFALPEEGIHSRVVVGQCEGIAETSVERCFHTLVHLAAAPRRTRQLGGLRPAEIAECESILRAPVIGDGREGGEILHRALRAGGRALQRALGLFEQFVRLARMTFLREIGMFEQEARIILESEAVALDQLFPPRDRPAHCAAARTVQLASIAVPVGIGLHLCKRRLGRKQQSEEGQGGGGEQCSGDHAGHSGNTLLIRR